MPTHPMTARRYKDWQFCKIRSNKNRVNNFLNIKTHFVPSSGCLATGNISTLRKNP
jgi:hypothetical protein